MILVVMELTLLIVGQNGQLLNVRKVTISKLELLVYRPCLVGSRCPTAGLASNDYESIRLVSTLDRTMSKNRKRTDGPKVATLKIITFKCCGCCCSTVQQSSIYLRLPKNSILFSINGDVNASFSIHYIHTDVSNVTSHRLHPAKSCSDPIEPFQVTKGGFL